MIGVYDYTVILTYLSLISGSLGIFVSLSGLGHPYYGVFFLLFVVYVMLLMVKWQAQRRKEVMRKRDLVFK